MRNEGGGFAAFIPLFSLLPLEGDAPKGAEVGSRRGIFARGDANPASLRSSAPSRGRGENDS